jgi:hypothetical protein
MKGPPIVVNRIDADGNHGLLPQISQMIAETKPTGAGLVG